MNKINIFVSSTCYDLSQIRTDMSEFILNQGHVPMLSEFDNFPVNPHKRAYNNCIEAVKNNADIFILIVGNRYGSTIENDKSITNVEFLTAKSKNIPIFIFIDKRTLTIHSLWKENKDGDFTKFVDNNKIFEFISEIRETDKFWTFEFEKAQDITSTLKTQLSYIFKESLKIHSKYNSLESDILNLDISNDAINIILQKDTHYEYEFFSKVLVDEMEKVRDFKNNLKYEIHFEATEYIYEIKDIANWFKRRIAVISRIISSLSNLINKAFPEFIKNPGEPSDLKGLYYVAKAYATSFKSLVNWTIETRNTIVPEECEKLKIYFSLYSKSALESVWKHSEYIYEQIQFAKNETKNGNKNISLNLNINIDVGDEESDNFHRELSKIEKEFFGED